MFWSHYSKTGIAYIMRKEQEKTIKNSELKFLWFNKCNHYKQNGEEKVAYNVDSPDNNHNVQENLVVNYT